MKKCILSAIAGAAAMFLILLLIGKRFVKEIIIPRTGFQFEGYHFVSNGL